MVENINNNKILVVSHVADIDGMGSVILANYLYNKKIDYILCEVTTLIGVFNKDLSNYDVIYICDLPLSNEVIEYLKNHEEITKKVKHFDHHESEVEKSNTYDFVNEVIELDGRLTCGTEIFYRHLLTVDNSEVINNDFFKEMVEGIRNNDTWDFKRTGDTIGTKLASIHAFMGSVSFINYMSNYEIKDHFYFTDVFLDIIDALEKKKERYIENALNNVYYTTFKEYKMGVIISEQYRSYLGNDIAEKNPDKVDFVLIISFERMSCSLRTCRDDIDLGIIANEFTTVGGGHKKAAGFPMNDESAPKIQKIINEYFDNFLCSYNKK